MSAYQFDEFERRMRRINRRHSKLSQGYVTAINSDGLVVARPSRRSNGATIRGLGLILVVILLFKGFLHAQLGPLAYEERVDQLAAGTIIEKAGAWAMTADPITLAISVNIASLVR
jgi:hypothetical protein